MTEAIPAVPELTAADVAFGSARHLPPWKDIPDEFKRMGHPCVRFVSKWFFGGLTKAEVDRLIPRDGVDKQKALWALQAALGSFEPKHEHKEAGCAYLLHQWFTLKETA